MEDLLALDLQDLPFTKAYFGIRRLVGTVLVQNGSDNYHIVLRGPHFGVAEAGERIGFSVSLDGVALAPPELGTAPDDAIFLIPAASVHDKFKEKTLVTLPLDVTITRTLPPTLFSQSLPDVVKQTFHVSLMPDYAGELKVMTTRPAYDWKVVLPPEPQDKLVTGSFSFAYAVANGAVLSSPSPGEQKVSDQIGIVCHEDIRKARQFPNKRVEFADSPIFSNGWDTDKYIGADPIDWDVANKEIFNKWGFNWSTWGNNACGPINSGRHCHIPSNVMLSNSIEATKDATGCHETSLGTPQWRNNHTSVTVEVLGGKIANPALWTLTFQPLSFVQVGVHDDEAVSYPVLASKPTPVDISRPQGTTSVVTFVPSVGKPKSGILGHDVTKGLKALTQGDSIGPDYQRFLYGFQYPAQPE